MGLACPSSTICCLNPLTYRTTGACGRKSPRVAHASLGARLSHAHAHTRIRIWGCARVACGTQECEECANVKLVRETVELSFEISPGMDTGAVITLVEEGEPNPDGDPGDLNVVLVTEVPPGSPLRRKGPDLQLTLGISLKAALAGFESEWEHLDGHKARRPPPLLDVPVVFAAAGVLVRVVSALHGQCVQYHREERPYVTFCCISARAQPDQP